MQDLELFKHIPGYKAILNAVLKNQIQLLIQQLAMETGEESVLMTASLEEGTLSQLGSDFGKTFLNNHDEIKAQFLGFCIKRKQLQKQAKEFQASHSNKHWSSRQRSQAGVPSRRSHPYSNPSPKCQKQTTQNSEPLKQGQFNKRHQVISNGIAKQIVVGMSPDETNDRLDAESSSPEGASDEDENLRCVKEEIAGNDIKHMVGVSAKAGIQDADETMGYVDDVTEFEENVGYIYVDIDETNSAGIEEEGELCIDEKALNLKIDNQKSDDHQEIAETEIYSENRNHAKQTHDDIADLKNTSCDLGNTEKPIGRPKRKLIVSNKCFNTEKSLNERKLELENYLNLEGTERRYACNLCTKRFKERHHLVYHLRTHSGLRPYVCNICKKSFTQSSSLNTHKKLHLKDMTCDYCGKVFRKLNQLHNHACVCKV